MAFGQLIDYLNSNRIFYPVQFQSGGFDSFEYSSAITQVEINVLPGTQLFGDVFRTATTGDGDCEIGFSGYLVDAS